jgi:hypothetical protein
MAEPVVVLDVHGCRPDLALVDVVLRVVLVGRRLGAEVQVVGAGPGLWRLLAFTGLDSVLPDLLARDVAADAGEQVGSELGRQPEAVEEPGVEEVVDVRDASVAQLEHLDRPWREPPAGPPGLVLGEGG